MADPEPEQDLKDAPTASIDGVEVEVDSTAPEAVELNPLENLNDNDQKEESAGEVVDAENKSEVVDAENKSDEKESLLQTDAKNIAPGGIELEPDHYYDVTIEQKPAGFYYIKNKIITVFKYGKYFDKLFSDSVILRVNDVDVTPENFDELYKTTPLPFTLHLGRIKGTIYERENGGPAYDNGPSEISKEELTSVLVVYMSVIIDWIGSMIVVPMLPYLAAEFGADNQELGYLVAVYQACTIPGGLIIGFIAQRFGTKYGILYSIFGSCVTLLAQGFAENYTQLMIFRGVAGLTGNSIPVALMHIGMRIPQKHKPRYMSYVGLCITFALILGPLIGGALSTYGLDIPFKFASGFAGVGFIFAMWKLKNHAPPAKSDEDPGDLSKENYIMFIMGFFKAIPYTVVISMVGPYMIDQFSFTADDLGYYISAHGLLVSFNTIFFFPFVVKKLGLYFTFIFGFVMMTISFSFVGMMQEWYWFALMLSPLAGAGFGLVTNSTNPLADRWVTPRSRAKVMAWTSVCDNVGYTLGPILFGALFEYGLDEGYVEVIWWVGAGLAFISGTMMVLFYNCVFKYSEANRIESKQEEARLAEVKRRHAMEDWKDENGTDEDYLELGKALGQLLSRRHYKWITYRKPIVDFIDTLFPKLTISTYEEYLDQIGAIRNNAKRFAQDFEETYGYDPYASESDDEEGKDVGDDDGTITLIGTATKY